VSVGGIEDAGLGQVAQKGFVFLNLLVAAWQVQRHFLHVVHVAVANVPDLQIGRLHFPFEANEVFQCRFASAGGNVDVVHAKLLANRRSSSVASVEICSDTLIPRDNGSSFVAARAASGVQNALVATAPAASLMKSRRCIGDVEDWPSLIWI